MGRRVELESCVQASRGARESVAVVGPGVHPEGQCYVRDGDLQGPEGAVEGET